MKPVYYKVIPKDCSEDLLLIFGNTHRYIYLSPASISIGREGENGFINYTCFSMKNFKVFACYVDGPDKEILPDPETSEN